jgi:hypothetical protein
MAVNSWNKARNLQEWNLRLGLDPKGQFRSINTDGWMSHVNQASSSRKRDGPRTGTDLSQVTMRVKANRSH